MIPRLYGLINKLDNWHFDGIFILIWSMCIEPITPRPADAHKRRSSALHCLRAGELRNSPWASLGHGWNESEKGSCRIWDKKKAWFLHIHLSLAFSNIMRYESQWLLMRISDLRSWWGFSYLTKDIVYLYEWQLQFYTCKSVGLVESLFHKSLNKKIFIFIFIHK